MNDRDRQVLSKIQKHILSVLQYCENCHTQDEFQADNMRAEACVFNLMQIGELAKASLSDECKAEIKNIPRHQIYGLRNRIVHGYSGVRLNFVWSIIQDDLPALNDEITMYL